MAKIYSYTEFSLRLLDAITRMRDEVRQYPSETEFQSILAQLEALQAWTLGEIRPTLQQKGQLNFGLLASRYLDQVNQDLAQELYEIASYVLHW